MTVWGRRVIFAAALAWLVYALAVWAPATANGDLVAPTTSSTMAAPGAAATGAATVDGHDVRWWAKRARRNASHVRTLQHAIRGHVGLGARHLESVSASPDFLTHAFLCIHGFEGSWTDPAKPFFGGVQMNLGFADTYGTNFLRAWGTPNRWPPFVQVAVAMNAYLSGRGFHPWPNTARFCGLLP